MHQFASFNKKQLCIFWGVS